MANHLLHLSLSLLLTRILLLRSTSAVDFVFNGFDSSDILLFGNASLESRILVLTDTSAFSIGRALYSTRIPTRSPNSSALLPFYTSFILSIAPDDNQLSGHGLVFIFAPTTDINGTNSAQHLGLFNRTNDNNPSNHVLGIEFDVFSNQEFNDINDNHVGVDVNSLASVTAEPAGYWGDKTAMNNNQDDTFHELKLNSGVNYQVWVDYSSSLLNVTMVPAGSRKPQRPLISFPVNLSEVFLDEMYVGFTAATGQLVQYHRILAWSFSNSNISFGDTLATFNLPSFVPSEVSAFPSKGFIAGITVAVVLFIGACCAMVFLFLVKRRKKKKVGEGEEVEEWELEYWPHRIDYQEISAATRGFSEENVIGFGGNGKVYKGVLAGGVEVAVKLISHETDEGMKEFVAEVSSLGRLKHRNLVGLRGWCKREKRNLALVYDYMENGSLDKRVFECEESVMLGLEDRMRVLKDVASGVLYLHEGWEARVLHRDIKASNVLLDSDMNARLGDFGLSRIHGRGQVATITTQVVGTVGYMAPEVVLSGRVSAQTDVFSFGVLILEVLCGRRPIEDGKAALVDWAWSLMERGELLLALDERLIRAADEGGFEAEEVEKVLNLGLLCTNPDPHARPTMRQVMNMFEGTSEVEFKCLDMEKLQQAVGELSLSFRGLLDDSFSLTNNGSMTSSSDLYP
ncbi:PREDICTED: L-type lectin-domain containing receptor kinase VII.1-like [Nelumbo nucifera]|uniref:non-specific serine/threonine protein kinase n=2 Tax=Nelumbo nucifera TaxID=4432 RepID=A0A822XU47_NELNU|nr:PREDICTED: L-type lectin-domain containing receptor kinase VII.1-like [Nelumbo nucifera]DAD20958.1 TPA_asm: hypothetical protein HUJ06_022421 [Nelumbo nucifera]